MLNFAQGAVATISAFTAWLVMDGSSWPWGAAFVLAILVGAPRWASRSARCSPS
ncbi:MAG: hypothetical protein R2717_00610 [Schumannella sp.]